MSTKMDLIADYIVANPDQTLDEIVKTLVMKDMNLGVGSITTLYRHGKIIIAAQRRAGLLIDPNKK